MSALERRRELARMTKAQLLDRIILIEQHERAMHIEHGVPTTDMTWARINGEPTDRENGSES